MAETSVRSRIQSAFREMIEKQPFSEITVSGIIQKAGISRMSFYRMYSDKYEMLESICFDEFYLFAKIFGKDAKWKDIVICILNTIKNNPRFYYALFQDDSALASVMKAESRISLDATGSTASQSTYNAWVNIFKYWGSRHFSDPIDSIYKELVLSLPIKEVLTESEIEKVVSRYESQTLSFFRAAAAEHSSVK